MRTAIWLLLVQASLGAFDTLYYHEYRLRLPHDVHTRVELRLHAIRDFAYAIIIGSLGFVTWCGTFAWILLALLVGEIVITLWDFIEEDRIRRLPPGERAMHAVMGIVYGAFLALFDSPADPVVEACDRLRRQPSRIPRLDPARARGGRLGVGGSGSARQHETGNGVTDTVHRYRRWFYAAAIYNAVWGTAVVLLPAMLLRLAGVNAAGASPSYR